MTNNNNNNNTGAESAALIEAAGKLARKEATTFPELVKLTVAMAEADAACSLGDSAKADLIGAQTFGAKVGGHDVKMSGPTFSKRLKVGRMAMLPNAKAAAKAAEAAKADPDAKPVAVPTNLAAFTAACERPSLDKFYEWLPKDAAMSKPRASKADKADKAEADDEAAEADGVKVKVAPIEVIFGLLPHCTAADLDRLGAEVMRLRTPVATVKAA